MKLESCCHVHTNKMLRFIFRERRLPLPRHQYTQRLFNVLICIFFSLYDLFYKKNIVKSFFLQKTQYIIYMYYDKTRSTETLIREL